MINSLTKRTIALILQFYRPLFTFNMFGSLTGIYIIIKTDGIMLANTILFKLALYGVCIGYQYFASHNAYFYFRNAGYAARRMYAYVFSIDFSIYIIMIIGYYLNSYGFTNAKG